MSWEDRVQETILISNTGERMSLLTEDVSLELSSRNSIQEFADFSGCLIQTFGAGPITYPLRIFFWGEDHDKQADAFLRMLISPTALILEHPFYGRLENIFVVGEIKRRDNLKTAANQTIFEVNFVQSAAFSFPAASQAGLAEAELNLTTADDNQSAQFAEQIKVDTGQEEISLIDQSKNLIAQVKEKLRAACGAVAEVQRSFDQTYQAINQNLQDFIGNPLTAAQGVLNLIKKPAAAVRQFSVILDSYKNLTSGIMEDAGIAEQDYDNRVNNSFQNNLLFLNATRHAMTLTAIEAGKKAEQQSGQALIDFLTAEEEILFLTQSDLFEIIDVLQKTNEEIRTWEEANRSALNLLDTGEVNTYQNRALAAVSLFLTQQSFNSRREIKFQTDRRRHFIELCSELYGITDLAFAFFINTNRLTSDEIIEIPRNRTIRYYV